MVRVHPAWQGAPYASATRRRPSVTATRRLAMVEAATSDAGAGRHGIYSMPIDRDSILSAVGVLPLVRGIAVRAGNTLPVVDRLFAIAADAHGGTSSMVNFQ